MVSLSPLAPQIRGDDVLAGKLTSKAVIRLCLEKLKNFIENPDQNCRPAVVLLVARLTSSFLVVKYLGLLGLHKLMKAHPRAVVGEPYSMGKVAMASNSTSLAFILLSSCTEHKDLILDCLKDDDVTIRHRALDLITSMVCHFAAWHQWTLLVLMHACSICRCPSAIYRALCVG